MNIPCFCKSPNMEFYRVIAYFGNSNFLIFKLLRKKNNICAENVYKLNIFSNGSLFVKQLNFFRLFENFF